MMPLSQCTLYEYRMVSAIPVPAVASELAVQLTWKILDEQPKQR